MSKCISSQRNVRNLAVWLKGYEMKYFISKNISSSKECEKVSLSFIQTLWFGTDSAEMSYYISKSISNSEKCEKFRSG